MRGRGIKRREFERMKFVDMEERMGGEMMKRGRIKR
jgi:hypothetical protein